MGTIKSKTSWIVRWNFWF